MSITDILSEWYNVIFLVSFITGILLSIVYGVLGHGGDVSSDIDHDMDHETGHDLDYDGGGIFAGILSFLGVGRCPISIIIIVMMITWGFIGLAFNALFVGMKVIPHQIYFLFSLGIASVLSVIATRYLSIGIAKIMPKMETSAVIISSLVGRYGTAKVSIDEKSGSARVSDENGTSHIIYCKTKGDETIGVNEEIFVLQYLAENNSFIVGKKPELDVIKS